MTDTVETREPESSTLCKACGLCCTGHLFAQALLKPDEIATAQYLGLTVLQPTDSEKPGFSLPCPLWQGQCTIYTHPHKPHICAAFECKLLKEVLHGQTALDSALGLVRRAQALIRELEALLPVGPGASFHARLLGHVEEVKRSAAPTDTGTAFRLKAGVLLILFERHFGVTGFFNQAGDQSP